MEGNTEFQELQRSRQANLKPESQTSEAGEARWLKRLKDRFGGVSKGEKKIGGHKITIDVFYNKHRSAEETRGMEEQFQKADILIPEVFSWTPDYLRMLRQLSSGEIAPEIALVEWGQNNPYYDRDESLFNLIYISKKPITIIDVPEGHPLDDREREIRFPRVQFGSDLGGTLDSVRQYIKEFADLQKEREAYMLEQLEPKIQELINTYPQLRNKRQINTLLSIGGAHTLLSDKLKNEYRTSGEINPASSIFSYKEEGMIEYMSGKPVDDEFVARIVAEHLLSKAHKKQLVTDDLIKDIRSVRKLVSKFSFDELKEMFEGAHDLNKWANMFVQGLKERAKVPTAGN